MPQFQALLKAVGDVHVVRGDTSAPVLGVAFDTRRISPGEVFVAIPGFRLNAMDLVPRAIELGASAIVAEQLPGDSSVVPVAVVGSARAALADLSAAFFEHPSRSIPTIGITGTDGKTSTTHLVAAILGAHGYRVGWLTTVNTRIGEVIRENAADNTTPEAPLVQGALAEMRDAGLDVAIVETSSHALALDRVRGVEYRVGVFTNLSEEHLNFHGSMAAYLQAKARLFEALQPGGLAVLNADDVHSQYLARSTRAHVLWYGQSEHAQLTAHDIQIGPRGCEFVATFNGQEAQIRSRLAARFNVSNWLAAMGAASYFGATLADLAAAAAEQEPVPGRMNLIDAGQPFPVVVDFAHTPHALESVLEAVRSMAAGRVLLVFGLAGGRDFHNRPVMGAIAARGADYFVISTDDPGDEAPEDIAREVANGARAAGGREGETFSVNLDRRLAIRHAVNIARPGDVVVLAGKGHERRMVVHGQRMPWNDTDVAREELIRRMSAEGHARA